MIETAKSEIKTFSGESISEILKSIEDELKGIKPQSGTINVTYFVHMVSANHC